MANLADAEPFLRKELAALKNEAFEVLARRPRRARLPTPASLHGLKLYVSCTPGERGSVEVVVEAQKSMLLIFSGATRQGFAKFPDGTVRDLYSELHHGEPVSRQPLRPSPAARVGAVELPPDIEQEVLEYLHREYGESPSDPEALKLADLRFEGEHRVDGTPKLFWSYPSNSGRAWVTVEQADDTYCVDTSDVGPKQSSRK